MFMIAMLFHFCEDLALLFMAELSNFSAAWGQHWRGATCHKGCRSASQVLPYHHLLHGV